MLSYELPAELIAQRPAEPRDAARLFMLERASGQISHRIFRELPDLLRPGDCLVLNDTKVLPARLYGVKSDTGGKVELLLLRKESDSVGRCLGQPGKRLQPGSKLLFNHGSVEGEVISSNGGEKLVRFNGKPIDEILNLWGEIPLLPYIRRPVEPKDTQWYQTVFSNHPGAVAAPTAGLHFTEQLLNRIRKKGIRIAFVTLHVGWGTFKPVGEEEIQQGTLHAERFQIPSETLDTIQQTKEDRGRVIAVGTTVVRTLESQATGVTRGPLSGVADLFIRPPFDFKIVDAMITNFHLPGTSLLYLVSAFAGEKQILNAYQEAIKEHYRFYSYGDAMFIQ